MRVSHLDVRDCGNLEDTLAAVAAVVNSGFVNGPSQRRQQRKTDGQVYTSSTNVYTLCWISGPCGRVSHTDDTAAGAARWCHVL